MQGKKYFYFIFTHFEIPSVPIKYYENSNKILSVPVGGTPAVPPRPPGPTPVPAPGTPESENRELVALYYTKKC